MSSVFPRIMARLVDDPPARIVVLEGEYDVGMASEVGRVLMQAVSAGDPVVVDLRRTTFADSSILGALILAEKMAGPRGLAVVLPSGGDVARLFELINARAVMPTFETLHMAVDWCHSGGDHASPRVRRLPESGR